MTRKNEKFCDQILQAVSAFFFNFDFFFFRKKKYPTWPWVSNNTKFNIFKKYLKRYNGSKNWCNK